MAATPMIFPANWKTLTENGFRVQRDTTTPLIGSTSLRMESLADEFTEEDLPKNGSIFLNANLFPFGTAMLDGQIRTGIHRLSSDQTVAWAGIFFCADTLGIVTGTDPTLNVYQVHDKDGSIKLYKTVDAATSTLVDTLTNLDIDTTYCLNVLWRYTPSTPSMEITISLGSALDGSDLVVIGQHTDIPTPITASVSEGLFGQTETHDGHLAYLFDQTEIHRVLIL